MTKKPKNIFFLGTFKTLLLPLSLFLMMACSNTTKKKNHDCSSHNTSCTDNSSVSSQTPMSDEEDKDNNSEQQNDDDDSLPTKPLLIQPTLEITYTQGEAIPPLHFNNSGLPIVTCTIHPDLPAGMSIIADQNSCQIIGTPSAEQAATEYTITATAADGSSDSVTAIIEIIAPSPELPPPDGEPGAFDLNFNTQGYTTTNIGLNASHAQAVTIQQDGKIIAVGNAHDDIKGFAIIRYMPDGSLDSSFNGTGIVVTTFTGLITFANDVALQSDGKIVVAGGHNTDPNGDFAVVRYNSDGSLDTTFNGTGKVVTAVGASHEEAKSVAIQSDGKIVVAGMVRIGASHDFTVVRYNSNGTLDSSFNGTGIVTTDFLGNHDYANTIIIQDDGKILVGGTVLGDDFDFALTRYNENGSLDTSFNGSGKLTFDLGLETGELIAEIILQDDGKIICVGHAFTGPHDNLAMARITTTGSLDHTFGIDGIVILNHASNNLATGVALQDDGKIIVVGSENDYVNSTTFGQVFRYTSQGQLDTSFNGTGRFALDSETSSTLHGVAIQKNGSIIAVGSMSNGTYTDAFLMSLAP